jgi:hypothetical protein
MIGHVGDVKPPLPSLGPQTRRVAQARSRGSAALSMKRHGRRLSYARGIIQGDSQAPISNDLTLLPLPRTYVFPYGEWYPAFHSPAVRKGVSMGRDQKPPAKIERRFDGEPVHVGDRTVQPVGRITGKPIYAGASRAVFPAWWHNCSRWRSWCARGTQRIRYL